MNLDLFPALHAELISLLRSLRRDDWLRPTACREWTVKDVAAHLLDGQLRRLSLARDAYIPPGPGVTSPEQIGRMINRMNGEWVAAAKRLSPGLLIELLEWTAPQLWQYFGSLDPDGAAVFPVAWAGESESTNAFDIAREFTEQWHHQQQIRDAVSASPLTDPKWLRPVLQTFVRALPHTYRDTAAADGVSINFTIEGPAGGAWHVQRSGSVWRLREGEARGSLAAIRMDQNSAWRMFTKSSPSNVVVEGDQELGAVGLGSVAVMG